MRARDNPFAVDRLHALRFRGGDVGALWTRAVQLRTSALVGAEGSGKTTLLFEVAAHGRSLGYRTVWVQLRRDARRLSSAHRAELGAIHADDVVCIDGADLLPRLDRWWVARRTRTATVIGTLHAPGWLPTLASLTTSPELLEELVGELTGAPVAALAVDREVLFARHAGNVRAALRELYDLRSAT
ncbi:MAG: hypothetical protein H0T42_32025 [Deltaproteobacteria bacterium]|nr:hypothetical protein [Deltaproteobacteria bacterium]